MREKIKELIDKWSYEKRKFTGIGGSIIADYSNQFIADLAELLTDEKKDFDKEKIDFEQMTLHDMQLFCRFLRNNGYGPKSKINILIKRYSKQS